MMKIMIIRKHWDPSFIPLFSVIKIAVLSGVAQKFPKKEYHFFKWKPYEFCILKHALLRQTHSLLTTIASSLFVLIMYLFVCASVTYMCWNVYVWLLCMWIILYSFIITIIISWFIYCLLIDLLILDITWICRNFFAKNLRFRHHWVD